MAYVYRFKDICGEVIYVGYTSQTLERRMKQHWEQGHLPSECYDNVSKIEFIEYNTSADAMIMETYFINEYKPKFNKLSKQLDKITLPFDVSRKWRLYKVLIKRKQSKKGDDLILKLLYIANFILISAIILRHFNILFNK